MLLKPLDDLSFAGWRGLFGNTGNHIGKTHGSQRLPVSGFGAMERGRDWARFLTVSSRCATRAATANFGAPKGRISTINSGHYVPQRQCIGLLGKTVATGNAAFCLYDAGAAQGLQLFR